MTQQRAEREAEAKEQGSSPGCSEEALVGQRGGGHRAEWSSGLGQEQDLLSWTFLCILSTDDLKGTFVKVRV